MDTPAESPLLPRCKSMYGEWKKNDGYDDFPYNSYDKASTQCIDTYLYDINRKCRPFNSVDLLIWIMLYLWAWFLCKLQKLAQLHIIACQQIWWLQINEFLWKQHLSFPKFILLSCTYFSKSNDGTVSFSFLCFQFCWPHISYICRQNKKIQIKKHLSLALGGHFLVWWVCRYMNVLLVCMCQAP